MTLEEGQQLALAGTPFGAVYETLYSENDRLLFKEWWLREPGVPTRPRRVVATTEKIANGIRQLLTLPSGDFCERCGGLMVRTGTCKTCQGCGNSSGGCS